MGKSNRKPKKLGVIGKYPYGGPVLPGGITQQMLDQMQLAIQEKQRAEGITPPEMVEGSMTGLTKPMDTTDPLEGLIPAYGATPVPETGSLPPPYDLGNGISKEIKKNAGLFSLLGGLQTGAANAPGFKPDVTQGITGGALSGVGVGLQMGGPMGGLIGGAIGGFSGLMSSGQKLEDYSNLQREKTKQRAEDRLVGPFQGFQFEDGGEVPKGYLGSKGIRKGKSDSFLNILYAEDGGDPANSEIPEGEELTPVQTEVGEMVLLSSGILSKVKAKMPHDKMDEDDVTDILPSGSFVFSNSQDNLLEITDDLKEDIVGQGTAFYSEEDEPDVEHVEFEKVLPNKKKATFAEIAEKIKSVFGTKPDHKDVFSNITNSENMNARVPFLQRLISLQNEVTGADPMPTTESLQAYGKGGKVKKIKHMEEGGYPTLEELMAKYNDYINKTSANAEQENIDRTDGDKNLESSLGINNVLANGIVGPLGYMMQNPYVKPAYTDTNLSGAMYRPSSNQALQGITNTGIGQNNSLVRQLLAQGVSPTDAISITAADRARETTQSNDLNYKAMMANDTLERDKFKFLSAARTSNEAADVAAYNTTTDNQNKTIAGLASSGQTLIKGDSTIDEASNNWRTQRAKDYYENLAKVGQNSVTQGTSLYQIGSQQKNFEDQLRLQKERLEAWKAANGVKPGDSIQDENTLPQDTTPQVPGAQEAPLGKNLTPIPIGGNNEGIQAPGLQPVLRQVYDPNAAPKANTHTTKGDTPTTGTPRNEDPNSPDFNPTPKYSPISTPDTPAGKPIKGAGGWDYIVKNGQISAKNPKSGIWYQVDPDGIPGRAIREKEFGEKNTK